MAYTGWLQLGDVELFNAPRVTAYAKAIAPQLGLKCSGCGCSSLGLALGDGEEYTAPFIDQPDWYDPDNPDSWQFAGLFPLSVSGLEDDSRQVSITEGIADGGTMSRPRRATREIRVTGLLVAGSEAALDLGMEWLRNALNGTGCGDQQELGCSGDDLCFLSSCPHWEPGYTDPTTPQLPHPISLTTGWSTTSGPWANGSWEPGSSPASATGPVLDPPCDDVRYVWAISPQGDQQLIQLHLLGENGDRESSSQPVRLSRTNYLLNPGFKYSTNNWTPGVSVAMLGGSGAAQLTSETALLADHEWVESNSTTSLESDWSGRMAVHLSSVPTFLNVIPNPSANSLTGVTADPNQSVAVSFAEAFVGPSSWLATNNSSLAFHGVLNYGETPNSQPERIGVEENTTYFISAQVRPTVANSESFIQVTWIDAMGGGISADITAMVPTPQDAWTEVAGSMTSPAGAVSAIFAVGCQPTAGDASPGDEVYFDALLMSPDLTGTSPGYFDGDTPGGEWTGAPHLSPSEYTPTSEVSAYLALRTGVDEVAGSPVTLSPGAAASQERVLTVSATDVAAGDTSLVLYTSAPVASGVELSISEAVLEKAATPGDYFDGDTAPDGYEPEWLGQDSNSASRIFRDEPFELVAPAGSGPIRPSIELLSGDGEVQTSSLTAHYREESDPQECLSHYLRTMREVATTDGPRVMERFPRHSGAHLLRVEFTLTAGNPWRYHTLPVEYSLSAPETVTGGFEPKPGIPVVSCEDEPVLPLNDPDCPLPPDPPRPPMIAECLEDVESYTRHAVGVPGDVMGVWQEGVPIVRLRTQTSAAARQVRVRFYPNPLERTSLDDLEECAFCGEFIVSYMPGNSELVIDGMTETAHVFLSGDRVRLATHLLYGPGGGPMIWPLLTCGIPYIMTVDTSPLTVDLLTTEMQIAVRS